jgi:membrane protease YdiL (CAAX protease family)
LLVTGLYLLFPGEYVSSEMNGTQIFSTLSVGIVFTGIAAGFVEEMVFRGFILNLLKNKWNIRIAIFIPAVLFGAVHVIGMNFSILSCLLVLIAGTMVGIMFSLIELENNSIWNSGIVHAIWNIIIIGGGLTVNEAFNEYSVMTYVLTSKNFAITGGEFGIESSIIAVIGYMLVSMFAYYMTKRKR